MYESPIDVNFIDIAREIADKQDEKIMAEVRTVMGVNIDKYELSKALAYDRDQYNKGYTDGYNEGLKQGKKWLAAELVQNLCDEYDIKIYKEGEIDE